LIIEAFAVTSLLHFAILPLLIITRDRCKCRRRYVIASSPLSTILRDAAAYYADTPYAISLDFDYFAATLLAFTRH